MPSNPLHPETPARALPAKSGPELGDTLLGGTSGASPVMSSLTHAGLLSPDPTDSGLGWLAHYRVLEVLGQGGMGMVFRAEDTHLQRTVALKVILPEFANTAGARERFLREARACAALKNDHIVTIYQVGQDRDVPYLAMEFLQGESLENRLLEGKPLSLPEVLRIGAEVATGLSAAHEKGLIHRDVKPANIWLEAPTGRVKLLDFGLVRTTGSRGDLTQVGRIVGTPEFMSPEQGRGEELDHRTDLFSLGVVLYLLCTGRKPFEADTVMGVLTALAVSDPPPVCTLNPDVPPALAELIERLLHKNRDHRPASANEVSQTLQAIIQTSVYQPSRSGSGPVMAGPALPPPPQAKRGFPGRGLGIVALASLLIAALALGAWLHFRGAGSTPPVPTGPPIRVGVLHSRTGTMAISERPVIDAVQFAIEEINAQGGLLGRPVEAVVADGQSDETVFARQAEKLIREDKVCVIFGCWTSASRKAVVPVIEWNNNLLFYPVQYEGVEESPHIVYLGPVPNQQILPALRWLIGFEGKKRWFLIGSDYVFPAVANAVIRDEAKARGCEIVGEEYLLLGSTDVSSVVQRIGKVRPDLIVNTINGDTNVAFFRALRRAGITPENVPTLSLSISEEELAALGPRDTAGDYVAANYFQSITTPENQTFLDRFSKHYGVGRVISSPMQSAYSGVHCWAKAVQAAGSIEPRAVRETIKGQRFDAPQGPVQIDPTTLHTIQSARIGRIDKVGRLVDVYLSPKPIVPEPFPSSRSKKEWLALLDSLHKRWGGLWSNPGR